MIQILSQDWVTLELSVAALFGVECIDFLVELVALVVNLLQLFVGGFRVVGLLVDGREFFLDSGEVLAHMENSQVVGYEGEPLLVLFVLLFDDVIAYRFKSIVLDVEQVIGGVLETLLNGLIKEFNHVREQFNDLADNRGEWSI